ncbi:ABC transporter substrate-binding protein [Niveispirillum sp.]|uniref:substrate-binding periplasmic protein n=1 Tax=Niveispirillum sp. TaxID=1917217 RepID=UPI001B754588|nr:transporter substrate-binding domain-containing protein [Niveispirillum sp.]MBP7338162.1 transporter substrate-binding domain-containing protein [Niveispirillum sp.]
MRFSLPHLVRPLSALAAILALTAGMIEARARDLTALERDRPIVVASDPWCPYACDPDADGREGYMVDLTREIFEGLGFKVEYRVVNFAMMKRMAKDGSATALPGMASDMEGAVLLPVLAQGNSANAVALARSQGFNYTKPQDFERFRLGVIKDYDYGGALQEYVDQNTHNSERITVLSGFGYSHLVQGLRMLTAGRIDMLLDDHNVLRWQMRRMGMQQQLTTLSLKDDADLFVGFSQNDPRAPELARLMAEGTRRMRENGRLAAIMRNYGLEEQAALLSN